MIHVSLSRIEISLHLADQDKIIKVLKIGGGVRFMLQWREREGER